MDLCGYPLSAQCLEAAREDLGSDNHAAHVLRLLRQVTDKPIWVLPNTYPIGNGTRTRKAYSDALAIIQSQIDPFEARLIPQPETSLNRNFFTKNTLMISPTDRHLNPAGAKIVMQDLLDQLAQG